MPGPDLAAGRRGRMRSAIRSERLGRLRTADEPVRIGAHPHGRSESFVDLDQVLPAVLASTVPQI